MAAAEPVLGARRSRDYHRRHFYRDSRIRHFSVWRSGRLRDFEPLWSRGYVSELIWAVAAWLAYLLVYIAVFVMYSVAWHRVFLAPENVTMIRDAYGWHRRQTRFLFAYAKVLGLLFLILFVPIVFAVILGGMASIVFNLLTVPTVIGMFWLYARLSILFPAIAVDNNLTIKGAYSFTEKNG